MKPDLDGNWIEVMSMAGDAPNEFDFGAFRGWQIDVQGVAVNSDDCIDVYVDGGVLKKSVGIPITCTNTVTGQVATQYVRTLNWGFPRIETISNGAEDGYYYFEPTLDWICKMRTDGEVIYYKYDVNDMFDFCSYVSENGEIYYGYRTPYADAETVEPLSKCGMTTSKQVIMDQNYRVVKEIYGMIEEDGSISNVALDNHDFIFFNLDHYITLSYIPTYVNNIPSELTGRGYFPSRVLANVIQEVKDGKVIFEWDSTDYVELYEMSVEGNDFDLDHTYWCDYVHMNSMDICANDGNIIVSMRHNDSVMEINRKTGEIEWILGGTHDMFGLAEEQKMCRQHFARFTEDGTITAFDNSTSFVLTRSRNNEYQGNGTGYARAVEYRLDEENLKLLDYASYDYGLPLGEYMGSAQKTDDSTFVMGWGHCLKSAPSTLFSEIDFETNTVLFEAINMSAPLTNNMTYRVNKYAY